MKNITSANRSEYYKISSFIFMYFFTVCKYWFAGYLAGAKTNLSGTVIGTVFAVNGIFPLS